MKIKLQEIVNLATGTIEVKSVLQELQTVKFPVKISYRIKRFVDKLNPSIDAYNEKRSELIKEYGDKNEENDTFEVKNPEKLKIYTEKMLELLDTEEDIDFEKIKIEEIGDLVIEPRLLTDVIFE